MSISLFGSCRINIVKNNNINRVLGYAHSTREILQQIKILLGEIDLPEPLDKFAFSTGIIGKNLRVSL